jgi:hypothetical protein
LTRPCLAIAVRLPCSCHVLDMILPPSSGLVIALQLPCSCQPSHCHCDAPAMHLPCSRRHGLAMFLLLALASLCELSELRSLKWSVSRRSQHCGSLRLKALSFRTHGVVVLVVPEVVITFMPLLHRRVAYSHRAIDARCLRR